MKKKKHSIKVILKFNRYKFKTYLTFDEFKQNNGFNEYMLLKIFSTLYKNQIDNLKSWEKIHIKKFDE